jgi:hypothetical protein
MELQFHLVPASKQSTDDGRKDRPKHVQRYSMNSKIMHLVGFTIEIHHDARSHERQNRELFAYLYRIFFFRINNNYLRVKH